MFPYLSYFRYSGNLNLALCGRYNPRKMWKKSTSVAWAVGRFVCRTMLQGVIWGRMKGARGRWGGGEGGEWNLRGSKHLWLFGRGLGRIKSKERWYWIIGAGCILVENYSNTCCMFSLVVLTLTLRQTMFVCFLPTNPTDKETKNEMMNYKRELC